MNVTLNLDNGDDEGCTLQDDLEEHVEILSLNAGYNLTGRQVLIPEGNDYPGSYQVWNETNSGLWVYVTPEGVVCETPNPIDRGEMFNG